MDRVSRMQDALNSSPVKFLEFTRIHANHPESLICFFEGEDVKYYGIRIESLLNGACKWGFLECRGKKDVLDLCEVVTNHADYKNAKTIFFIDRDFDPPIDHKQAQNTYETPCYSIENFYTSESCFKKILESEFKITEFGEQAKCYNNCITMFTETKQMYHAAIAELNAFIKSQRIKEKEGKTQKLNLNNVSLNKLVRISLGEVVPTYSIDNLREIFPEAMEVDQPLFDTCMKSFEGENVSMVFRGKYELEFLRQFISKLKDDRQQNKPKLLTKKASLKLNLSKKNIISELSQYADTPPCLVQYFEKKRRLWD